MLNWWKILFTQDSAYTLGLTKIDARCFPSIFTVVKKQRLIECFEKFIEPCREDQEAIIQFTLTGKKTMT